LLGKNELKMPAFKHNSVSWVTKILQGFKMIH